MPDITPEAEKLAEKIYEGLFDFLKPKLSLRKKLYTDIITPLISGVLEEARKGEQQKLSMVLDFCKGAIEDAIYSDDGLDSDAGQAVIKMIENAKNGLAEGCSHCELYAKEAIAKERERCALIAKQIAEDELEKCMSYKGAMVFQSQAYIDAANAIEDAIRSGEAKEVGEGGA